ncbi:RHS repeat protein [Streptomyces nodosus]|uniref:Teneurin-like YD-shell domain-containing protein n=1 Tax=Streptomyces nodosus TaxID=40318 RepID=A0A0B5DR26_9ACTN|nr:RHS repeat protein [Streptomyces nodosus]AJE43036.1 hypothetical protein SNOD_25630 [Streptomyces nodosus]MBB4794419.1 YD repeat-containing protein [Streptomyces nodosus]
MEAAAVSAEGAAGKVAKVTNPDGAVTAYTYDKSSALLTAKNPKGRTQTYSYDAASRLKTATTPAGRTTSYTYDISGRLTEKALPGGSVHYGYDSLGRTTSVTHSDNSDDLAYVYDDNLLASTTLTAASGTTAEVDYTYDAAGNTLTTTRQNGPTTTRAYDATGELTSLTHTQGSSTLTKYDVTWNDAGSPAAITTTRGSTATTTLYSYDSAGQLTVEGDLVVRVRFPLLHVRLGLEEDACRLQRQVENSGLVLRPLPLPVAGGRLAADQARVHLQPEHQEALRLGCPE